MSEDTPGTQKTPTAREINETIHYDVVRVRRAGTCR